MADEAKGELALGAPPMRPFLLSYGGGHANIMIEVARELIARGRDFELMGLTTAPAAFVHAGLAASDPREMLHLVGEAVRRKAAALTPIPDHPDIALDQAQGYFAVGYADLVERYGDREAEERVVKLGRKAFEPVSVFRRYFGEVQPSVVVTTTSPRFELAAIKAARSLGIPTLAIGDMYLVAEQEWIVGQTYADHLVVMSDDVAAMLRGAGTLDSQLHVLGNPAFDLLAAGPGDHAMRADLRCKFGFEGATCILWPLGGTAEPVAERLLLPPLEVAAFFERLCARDPSFRYLLRAHPNWPVPAMDLKYGIVDPTMTLEQALLVADVVAVEASTVGLQAVLKGIPTVCYNFSDYVIYPELGWAAKADSLPELEAILRDRRYSRPPASLSAYVGGASARVVDLLTRIARGG